MKNILIMSAVICMSLPLFARETIPSLPVNADVEGIVVNGKGCPEVRDAGISSNKKYLWIALQDNMLTELAAGKKLNRETCSMAIDLKYDKDHTYQIASTLLWYEAKLDSDVTGTISQKIGIQGDEIVSLDDIEHKGGSNVYGYKKTDLAAPVEAPCDGGRNMIYSLSNMLKTDTKPSTDSSLDVWRVAIISLDWTEC